MRCAPWVVLLPLLGGISGCIPLFYAYPAVSFVPPVSVGKLRDKIYAFRVDIADHKSQTYSDSGSYVLRQIHVSKSGIVTGQAKVSLDSGYYWNCFIECFGEQTNHTVRLRFYRPGYDLIEVHAWQTEGGMVWHEADNLQTREKALDRLLGPSKRVPFGGAADEAKTWGFDRLAPGSASPDHRCALLFAAAEYERLSARASAEGDEDASDHCSAKAKWLRERAEQ